jgi:hypothetical protein
MARSFNVGGASNEIIIMSGTGSSGNVLDITGPMSVSCWVNFASLNPGTPANIFAKGYDGTSITAYFLELDTGSELQFATFNSAISGSPIGAVWPYTVPTDLVTGTWYNIVGTFDGAHWQLYKNNSAALGQLASTTTPQHNAQLFSIGGVLSSLTGTFSPTQFASLNGLADVSVWSGALNTTTDIPLLAGHTGVPGRRANNITSTSATLVGYWPLLQTETLALAPDHSGNGHDGTATGTTLVGDPPTTMLEAFAGAGGPPMVLATIRRRFLRR